jgi:hypothetical protein
VHSFLQRTVHRLLSWWWLILLGVGLLTGPAASAQLAQAPVEVRVPQAPQPVASSDGLVHVAYELHITNYYPATGVLHLRQLTILADEQPRVLASFTGPQVNQLLAHPASGEDSMAVVLEPGKRVVLFLWLALPPGQLHQLRHRLVFTNPSGGQQVIDGVRVPLNLTPPLVFGAPLRAGPWLTYAGPGNHLAHHWSGVVVINGQTTIPQRYAIDFYGLTPAKQALRRPVDLDHLRTSTHADWVGFGADVLAVADGIVRDARDGEPNHLPLDSQPTLTDLTERLLMGNFVVLEVAPHVFVHYAHLQPGSLAVKVGDRVRRGAVLGRLGQSGQSQLPHLHFQVSNAVTFEEAEGLPFVFQQFDHLGSATLLDVLVERQAAAPATVAKPSKRELPVDGDVITFK